MIQPFIGLRMITDERLEYLRQKEVRDRRKLRRMVKIAIFAVVVGVGFTSLDLSFTPIVGADAVVEAKADRWTLKHGDQCSTYLDTSLGKTSILDPGKCSKRPWSAGDRMKIAARIGRMTRTIYVMRDYGVFSTPHIDTAGGLDIFPTRDYVKNPPEPVQTTH